VFRATGDTERPYTCMILEQEYPVGSGMVYSDDMGDLVAKVCASYNGGFRDEAYMYYTWDAINNNREDFAGSPYNVRARAINYGITLKGLLGLQ